MRHSTATARRDLRELEAAVRAADVLLRRSGEVAWSGRAADGFQETLEDLARRVHRAVVGLETMETTMARHLRSVEDAHLPALGDPSAGLPMCTAGRGKG